jgi:Ca2+-binding EF-hand superfamily protein
MRRVALGVIVLALAAPVLAQQPQGAQGRAANPANAERRAAAFARLDTNHDGVLSLEEWTAGRQAAARKMRQRQVRLVRQRVRRMDTNRDGAVSRDEWRGQAQLFDRIDADKDGKLTPAEFAAFRRSAARR